MVSLSGAAQCRQTVAPGTASWTTAVSDCGSPISSILSTAARLSTLGSSARYPARPSRTQALCPPSPIAFESATSTSTRRASFGT